MKSRTNKTNYDDKLFYQAITTALQNLLICPNANVKLQSLDKTIKLSHDKAFVVYATAPGTICLSLNEVRILHDNNVSTVYTDIIPAEDIINGQKVKQNDVIGQALKSCQIKIEINPIFWITDNK